jgi:Uma2 family endonuclease
MSRGLPSVDGVTDSERVSGDSPCSAASPSLAPFVRARKLGRVFGSSQGFALPSGDPVEPDASFVSKERWAAGPAPVDGEFLRVVPDLVFEIISRGTAAYDRGEKKAIYEANGVREYWIVDTRAREVVGYALDGGAYGRERVFVSNERAASTVLPELAFDVADLLP